MGGSRVPLPDVCLCLSSKIIIKSDPSRGNTEIKGGVPHYMGRRKQTKCPTKLSCSSEMRIKALQEMEILLHFFPACYFLRNWVLNMNTLVCISEL